MTSDLHFKKVTLKRALRSDWKGAGVDAGSPLVDGSGPGGSWEWLAKVGSRRERRK